MPNRSPIVGIVLLHSKSPGNAQESMFFLKSYSKWLEQFNIRWIPMFMEESEADTEEKLSQINGIFLTGGAEPFLQ